MGHRQKGGSAGNSEASAVAEPRGTVYTFYSFKGGVGHSMAVANVAPLLAKWGHRLLVVDWDLEAPAIERYFEQLPSRLEGSSREAPGLLDLLESLEAGRQLEQAKNNPPRTRGRGHQFLLQP